MPDVDSLLCPHFEFRPEYDHGFMLIPFQNQVECSQYCIDLVSFLVTEASGYQGGHPQSQLQDWVRRSLQSYAPLFVRVLSSIPTELIPPTSHILNIDRQIEGRLVTVDFKRDEAVFKLDNTSARKLEVFYTELTGNYLNCGLTVSLDELRVRMAISDVIGLSILKFRQVVGGLFDIDQHACVAHESKGQSVSVQQEWVTPWCPLNDQQGNFIPTLTQFEVDCEDTRPVQVTIGDSSDSDQLEIFPQDASTSPQPYWEPEDCNIPSKDPSKRVSSLSQMSQQTDPQHYPSLRRYGSSETELSGISLSESNCEEKLGCGLSYVKPTKLLYIPPIPPPLSRVDPPPASLFTLLQPFFPSAPISGGRIGAKSPRLPQLCTFNDFSWGASTLIPDSYDKQKTVQKVQKTPCLCSETVSIDLESEVTTPSNASTSHPPIYDAFLTVPVNCGLPAQDSDSDLLSPSWVDDEGSIIIPLRIGGKEKKQRQTVPRSKSDNTMSTQGETISNHQPTCSQYICANQIDKLSQYSFELNSGSSPLPLPIKTEKEPDSTKVIIQEKVKAMLDAAQTEGYICKAARDGVDNHPISVRLRSISGNHSSMKQLPVDEGKVIKHDLATDDSKSDISDTINQSRSQSSFLPLIGVPSNEGSRAGRNLATLENALCVGDSTRISPPLDIRVLRSSWVDQGQLKIQDVSQERTGLMVDRECLQKLKSKLEYEEKEMWGSLRRTLQRIEILDAKIREDDKHLTSQENKTREMIECWGYNETMFTEENTSARANPIGYLFEEVCGKKNGESMLSGKNCPSSPPTFANLAL